LSIDTQSFSSCALSRHRQKLQKERRAKEKAASELESLRIGLLKGARLGPGERATVEAVARNYMDWFQNEKGDVSIDEYARKTNEVKEATDSIVENVMDAANKPKFLAKLKRKLRDPEEQS
jgi:hypothetical protein